MEQVYPSMWIYLRILFAIAIPTFLGWRLLKHWPLRVRDALLYGSIGILSLLVIVQPSAIDWFLDLGRIRAIPLGRLVVLLLFAQLFWLAAFLILRERSNAGIELHENLVRTLSAELEKANAKIHPAKFREIMMVLPAYREEENITHVLEKIPTEVDGYPIGVVVVVDGVADPTYDVVRERFPEVVVLRQVVRIGSGAALHLGYQFCAMYGVRIVVSMDSDGQHSPEDLPTLLAPLLAGTHDVVIGNRLKGGWEVTSAWRFVGLHIFGFIVHTILRINAWDCSNTYRAFLLEPVMGLGLEEVQYHTLELIFKAHRAGLRIGEAPVRVLARKSGSTKKGSSLYYGYQFLKKLLRYG